MMPLKLSESENLTLSMSCMGGHSAYMYVCIRVCVYVYMKGIERITHKWLVLSELLIILHSFKINEFTDRHMLNKVDKVNKETLYCI